MTQHTQGPWKPHRDAQVRTVNTDMRIAEVDGADADEMAANTWLIAAAPDMLAALKSAEIASQELCYDQDPANQCWVTLQEIRDAIAKAEGR
jgi:hypothetical protein